MTTPRTLKKIIMNLSDIFYLFGAWSIFFVYSQSHPIKSTRATIKLVSLVEKTTTTTKKKENEKRNKKKNLRGQFFS